MTRRAHRVGEPPARSTAAAAFGLDAPALAVPGQTGIGGRGTRARTPLAHRVGEPSARSAAAVSFGLDAPALAETGRTGIAGRGTRARTPLALRSGLATRGDRR